MLRRVRVRVRHCHEASQAAEKRCRFEDLQMLINQQYVPLSMLWLLTSVGVLNRIC